jgi:hypothetical protein
VNITTLNVVDKHSHVVMCHKIHRDGKNHVQGKLHEKNQGTFESNGVLELGRNIVQLAIMQEALISNGEDAIGATPCEFSS